MKRKSVIIHSILIIFCATFLSVTASAQDTINEGNGWSKSFIQKVEQLLSRSYNIVNYDTTYIGRPETKFLFKTQMALSGITYGYTTKWEGSTIKAKLHTNTNASIHLGITYLDFSLGFSFNPTTLFKHKSTEYEIGFTSYGNSYYFDINYYKSKTFAGSISFDGYHFPIDKGELKIKFINISGYYSFNRKRFSFPAAFNQTYMQKRSAGSVLAGFSIQQGKLEPYQPQVTDDEEIDLSWSSKMIYIGIGVGYGYNLILGKGKWLFHGSVIPNYIIYNRSKDRDEDGVEISRDKSFHFILNAHFAVVHFIGPKYLIGMSYEINDLQAIQWKNEHLSQNKWLGKVFLGLRF